MVYSLSLLATRMHSSRVRTVRFSGCLFGGGGVCPGCLLQPPPVDRQMPVKILPCPKLRLQVVIIDKYGVQIS